MGVNMKYCNDCKCSDPDNQDDGCSGGCKFPNYKGDGNCDDENNNCGCQYDGGDCCSYTTSVQYCQACQCLDPAHQQDFATGNAGILTGLVIKTATISTTTAAAVGME